MQRFLLLGLFFVVYLVSLNGQDLVSSQFVNRYTSAQLFSTFGIPARSGVELYKLQYTTLDAEGLLDTASGLVVIPMTTGPFPLLCHQHGTIDHRDQVPSAEQSHFGELYLGSEGFLVSSADFIGCGDSRGYHPYLHAATEASAAIDLLRAVRTFTTQQGIVLDSRLFVTGYSQGGHAGMAAFQQLEQDFSDKFQVTAAVLMSGPYDVTGTMRGLILSETAYDFPGYLGHIAKGYKQVDNELYNELTDIFKPRYAAVIERFEHLSDFGLFAMNDTLVAMLTEEFGASIGRFMVQDSVVAAFERSDTSNNLYAALEDNNLFNWIPKAPTRLYYCEADEQVPFTNAVTTDSIMNALGAQDVASLSLGRTLDHFGCAIPAYLNASTFFKGFRTVSTQPKIEEQRIRIYPNPATDYLTVATTDLEMANALTSYKIFDQLGRLLDAGTLQDKPINIQALKSGIYLLTLTQQNQVATVKFIK